jgi:alpha-beta hydrolase superfamily lysophospholipase
MSGVPVFTSSLPECDDFTAGTSLEGCTQEPLYFRSGERQLFGWMHRPAEPTSSSRLGVVLCAPFGFEAMCIYRTTRAFALAIAQNGIPALRFDYTGTGNSEDLSAASDQIEIWKQDIHAALDELRHRTGVERVCLLGVRLGALLASLAASELDRTGALIAVAPISSGRRYLRELELTNWHRKSSTPELRRATLAVSAAEAGAVESEGFVLSATSVAKLDRVDLLPLGAVAADVLILDRSDLPVGQSWSEYLTRGGARVRYMQLPDYAQMMKPPQFSVIPQTMIEVVLAWLRTQQESGVRSRGHASSAEPDSVLPEERLQLTGGDGDATITERPLWMGEDPMLFGIVSEPRAGEVRRRGVVLLNSGGDHHIGPRRMYVSLARRWAQRGYVVLRMDLAGLGDSGTRASTAAQGIFPAHAVDDIAQGVDILRALYGVREVTLCGLCSGAYHALRAAVLGLPVDRILMVNPLKFLPTEARQLQELELAEVLSSANTYRRGVTTLESWRKLLRGQVDLERIIKVYLRRALLTSSSLLHELARHLGLRFSNDLGQQLQVLAARGIRLVFVFSREDSGLDLLRMQAGSALKRISHCMHLYIVDGTDHEFTMTQSRAGLERILSGELYAQGTVGLASQSAAPRSPGLRTASGNSLPS